MDCKMEERINQKEDIKDLSYESVSELCIFPLREMVIFPGTLLPITISGDKLLNLINHAINIHNRHLGVFLIKDVKKEEIGPDDLYTTGVQAIIHRMMKLPDGTARLILQGLSRIRIVEFLTTSPFFIAKVEASPEKTDLTQTAEALLRNTLNLARKFISLTPYLPDELHEILLNIDDPLRTVYMLASLLRIKIDEKQAILEIDSLEEKLKKINIYLTREIELLELGNRIQSEAQKEMEKINREFFLRQQLKAIKQELGEIDDREEEVRQLLERLSMMDLPQEVRMEAEREIKRLERVPPASPEYTVIRNYIDWILDLPWNVTTEDNLDLDRARMILDEDHHDLEEVKERILEFLAVRKLSPESKAPILCFVGPPGVGKTSLGRSIARALGRKFVRISLGGIRDEAEIRGHRRTYIGALPGKIIQSLKIAGSKNPVFMMDEIDKIGSDFRGDPSSALLEVLDPEQNNAFRDHYLDLPFDLSKVLFITTANTAQTIQRPLLDRMEIIRIPGYSEDQKLGIAKKHIIPRLLKEHGLCDDEISIDDGAILKIILSYTREAGVRELERQIARIFRKVAFDKGAGRLVKPRIIKTENLTEYLGPERVYSEIEFRTSRPGVATGLAWTEWGGDIIFVEAAKMPGKKGFLLTGHLGEVMQESAKAALSYIRSKAKELGIEEDFFEKYDIHVHVPLGAIPKDGPSAGITMVTAIVSLLKEKPVRKDIAMSGEITLSGLVLPVGGIKEKVLAAKRSGIKKVVLPKKNSADIEEILKSGRLNDLEIITVDTIEEALKIALEL